MLFFCRNLLIDFLGLLLRIMPDIKQLICLKKKVFLSNLKRKDLVAWRYHVAKNLGVKLGKNCRLYSIGFYSEPYLVELGDNVIVSGDVKFITHDGGVYLLHGKVENLRGHYGRIKVGNNTFIGMNAIILPNISIGDNCIVGAGAVVTKSVAANSVVAGNPARVIMQTDFYLKMKKFSKNTILWSDYPFPFEMPDNKKRCYLERVVPEISRHG